MRGDMREPGVHCVSIGRAVHAFYGRPRARDQGKVDHSAFSDALSDVVFCGAGRA